jgi:uncharacterized membrane protein
LFLTFAMMHMVVIVAVNVTKVRSGAVGYRNLVEVMAEEV